MSHINFLKLKMQSLSTEFNLPLLYKSDLAMDLADLDKWDGCKLVWLLRTCGTILVPVRLGVTPTMITHWLWADHDQTVHSFIIDTTVGTIEKVDFEVAEKEILSAPCHLTSLAKRADITKKVNDILKVGCEKRIWGIFHTPSSVDDIGDWNDWNLYFKIHKNKLMESFMSKAIRMRSIARD